MPYALSLQAYTRPGFYRQAPAEWERRLREISPDLPNIDRLVFRYHEGHESWANEHATAAGLWVLYTAKPIRMVEKERARQFEKHWSELSLVPEAAFPEGAQAARQAMVSDYQHFMWHSQGLYVKPFLILQGEWGGTPAKYTEQEHAFLKASHCLDEPFDIGMFPPCPFDERVVKQILTRDRLLQQSGSYEAVEALDSSDGIGREFAEAEKVKRVTYLSTWSEMIQPAVEFYKRMYTTKKTTAQPQYALAKAPDGLNDTLAQWRERFLETGDMMGVTPASQKTLHGTTISVR